MDLRRGSLVLVALGLALPVVTARDEPSRATPSVRMTVPPPTEDPGLPALPARSPRNANYTIQARLDAERHLIEGHLDLEWRNTTGAPAVVLPVPPLLERLPEQPVDVGPRAGAAGAPGAAMRGAGDTRTCSRITLRRRRGGGRPHADHPIRAAGRRQHRRPHGHGGHDAVPGAGRRHRPLPRRLAVPDPPRRARPRGLGPRLPLHRAVVPQDRRLLEGGVERASVPPHHRVLLRLRRLRRRADPPRRVRRGGHGRAPRDARRGGRDADLSLLPGGRARLHLDGEPAFPREDRPLRGRGLPAGRHPAPRAARARAPVRALHRGDAGRAQGVRRVVGALPVRADHGGGSRVGIRVRRHGVPDPDHRRGQPVGPARAVQPGERHHPRGRPSVLVRARRHQRVRGALARRRLQSLPRPQGLPRSPTAGADGASATSASPAARSAGGPWWPRGSTSAAARTSAAACANTAAPT